MGVIKALDGNAAIAHGVMRSKVQLVAAYPIHAADPYRGDHLLAYRYQAVRRHVHNRGVGALGAQLAHRRLFHGVRTFTASASTALR